MGERPRVGAVQETFHRASLPCVVRCLGHVRSTVTLVRRSVRMRCEWCGRELPVQEGLGRRRRYCAHACRQRAYENRNAHNRGDLPTDAVVLTASEAADLADRLYQMRCAAEDVATAVTERVKAVELAALVDTLMSAARAAERLR